MFDNQHIKSQFPIFQQHPELVYLDSASTTQKPDSVINAERFFYENQNANVHRGIYGLAVEATKVYENTREKVAQFLNAPSSKEIIFTSGTTESVNLVAQSFALNELNENDEIIISLMEHHSNLVPWQQVCFQKKAKLVVIPFDTEGVLDVQNLKDSINLKTKLVTITHISNTLGTVNPIAEIIEFSHQKGVPVFVDAAQSIATQNIDIQLLNADFLVFSAHKLFGPTGVGVLYAKEVFLNKMTPYKYGGEMIRDVTFERTTFAPIPQKFEAGTPNIAGVAGLSAAIDFVENIGRDWIAKYLKMLLDYSTERLLAIDGLQIIGQATEKSAIQSFLLRGIHPHDVATILGEQHICVRAGHHCTQPIMDFLDIPGTTRASFSIYNKVEDIDKLVAGIKNVQAVFKRK